MAKIHSSEVSSNMPAATIEDTLQFISELMELCKPGAEEIIFEKLSSDSNIPTESPTSELTSEAESSTIGTSDPKTKEGLSSTPEETKTDRPQSKKYVTKYRFLTDWFWKNNRTYFKLIINSHLGSDIDLSSFGDDQKEPYCFVSKSMCAKLLCILKPMIGIITFIHMYPFSEDEKPSTLKYECLDKDSIEKSLQELKDLPVVTELYSLEKAGEISEKMTFLWNVQKKLVLLATSCAGNLLKLLQAQWEDTNKWDIKPYVIQAREVTSLIKKIRIKCLEPFQHNPQMPFLAKLTYITCLNGEICICCTKLCEEFNNLRYYHRIL